MQRLDRDALKRILRCPDCLGELESSNENYVCNSCARSFTSHKDRPILFTKNNELFSERDYSEASKKNTDSTRKSPEYVRRIKRWIPGKSVNLVREGMFKNLSKQYVSDSASILVVGCGNQVSQLANCFRNNLTVFVFCDISKGSDADVLCDSHVLPFHSGTFDGVISTAVLEHVAHPEVVIKEIGRVLKKNGFIYSEIPFLQAVHEGAYDFTRFTFTGHRLLCSDFKEIESGMVAGPGTALLWSIVGLAQCLAANKRVSSALGISARILFFWIKYIDYPLKNRQSALDFASCTYFFGIKSKLPTSLKSIVSSYDRNGST